MYLTILYFLDIVHRHVNYLKQHFGEWTLSSSNNLFSWIQIDRVGPCPCTFHLPNMLSPSLLHCHHIVCRRAQIVRRLIIQAFGLNILLGRNITFYSHTKLHNVMSLHTLIFTLSDRIRVEKGSPLNGGKHSPNLICS
jgi:hypothetical protein